MGPVVLDADTLRQHVARLGAEIARDHPDGVVLVGVLKGALIFLSDLARAIPDVPVEIDFMSISRFAPDSGRVKILYDVQIDLTDRDVVVVEDVVDTGLTLAYLMAQLQGRAPRRLSACALLDRPSRRIVPQPVQYRGVEVGEQFLLGYGLHYRDAYRNLPFIFEGDRDVVNSHPMVYVAELYPAATGQSGAENPGGRVPGVEEVP
ncbi:MAG: hypoxanthine phosphoribosyltransferase [Actinomycetota bacterium]|nr:hypoxanthine phosphoribosyltransferase [Actinomycetota bacterium]